MRLRQRNLNDITDALSGARAPQPRARRTHRAILDGEIVAFDDDGRPELRARCSGACTSAPRARHAGWRRSTPVTYMIFDLLWLDGHPLMRAALQRAARARWRRSASTRRALADAPSTSPATARSCWRRPRSRGSRASSPSAWTRRYEPGGAQRRVGEDQERRAPGARDRRLDAGRGQRGASASARCCVGVYATDGALRYAGRVGTRLHRGGARPLAALLAPLRARRLAVRRRRASRRARRRSSSRELVAEVEFSEWTATGMLRHPSYKGLREDKPARRRARARAEPRAATVATRQRRRPRAEAVQPRQGAVSARPASPSATSSTTTRASRRCCSRTCAAAADAQALARRRRRASSSSRSTRPRTARTGCARRRSRRERAASRSTTCSPRTAPTLVWLANLAALELHTPLLARADVDRAPDDDRLRPRPGRAGDGRGVLRRSRCCCSGMFDGPRPAVLRRRPRAPRGCRSTCRSTRRTSTFAQTSRSPRRSPSCWRRQMPDLVVAHRPRRSATGKVLVDWIAERRAARRRSASTRCAPAERPTVSTPLTWDEVRARADACEEPDVRDRRGAGARRRARRPLRARRVACAGASRVVTSVPCGRCASCWTGCGSLRRNASRRAANGRWRPSTTASAATRTRSPSPSRPRSRPSDGAWLTARRR